MVDAPWTDDDPDREFRIAVQVPLAQLLAQYRAACDRHRLLVADLHAGKMTVRPRRPHVVVPA